jgi:RNA polymerase-binding transcription factor DksA
MLGRDAVSRGCLDSSATGLAEKTCTCEAALSEMTGEGSCPELQPIADAGAARVSTLMHELARVERRIYMIDKRCREPLGNGGDRVDRAIALTERSRTMVSRENLRVRMHQAIHALERAEQGNGEVCEVCSCVIDPSRLRVMPETTVCVDCKRDLEAQHGR